MNFCYCPQLKELQEHLNTKKQQLCKKYADNEESQHKTSSNYGLSILLNLSITAYKGEQDQPFLHPT
jgi:hypothetical protein